MPLRQMFELYRTAVMSPDLSLVGAAAMNARDCAKTLGVPLAYLYADNSDLAEVILAFGLLSRHEQHLLAAELKARISRFGVADQSGNVSG